ncbi:Uncharacterised protein [Serratia rubidaea]|uniref:Uncharacterized protein n=1 Tax=Serratia rubidaea TaxID=61652 RepID=A0A3S4YL81_SERRU|nr:Uncharacterised protein [Serratia rubidaea]
MNLEIKIENSDCWDKVIHYFNFLLCSYLDRGCITSLFMRSVFGFF